MICIFYFFYFSVPAIKDIPFIIDNNYMCIEGYASSNDTTKGDLEYLRTFIIKNDKEEARVKAHTGFVYIGDYMKVNYLPNSHYGTVIERSE